MTTKVELKSALEGKLTELKTAVDSLEMPIDDNGTVHLKQEDVTAINTLKSEVKEIRGLMGIDSDIKSVEDFLKGDTNAGNRSFGGEAQVKDIASMLLESDEFKDMVGRGSSTMRDAVQINRANITAGYVKAAGDPLWTGLEYEGGNNFAPRNVGSVTQDLGVFNRIQQPQRVRDLFPVTRTNANYVEYLKVLGLVENGGRGNANVVAEYAGGNFGLKPESNIMFANDSAPIRTIAHWTAAHRNVLADKPQLRSIIDQELMYGLALVEDDQLLNGNGTGENLLGLLNQPDTQSYTTAVGEQKTDAVRRAMTKAALAMFPATGIILHPNDWEDIELQKAAGDGHYMVAQSVQVGAQGTLWRLPVVETPVIPEGTFLTGAFGQAARILDREQANIRVAEQHADFFIRNAIVILAEERLGLAVPRPEGLVIGTFEAPTTP